MEPLTAEWRGRRVLIPEGVELYPGQHQIAEVWFVKDGVARVVVRADGIHIAMCCIDAGTWELLGRDVWAPGGVVHPKSIPCRCKLCR